MLSPKPTGGSKDMKRSWTLSPSVGSRALLERSDEGVGNGESLGSRFGAGDPGELSLSAGREDMVCRLGTIESAKVRSVVEIGQCKHGSVADIACRTMYRLGSGSCSLCRSATQAVCCTNGSGQ